MAGEFKADAGGTRRFIAPNRGGEAAERWHLAREIIFPNLSGKTTCQTYQIIRSASAGAGAWRNGISSPDIESVKC
jgi:hypothetical protein